MLACARVGAIHSVVFGGFFSKMQWLIELSIQALRWLSLLMKAYVARKKIPLKKCVDDAFNT